ncbi:FadR/GntR family transcriptional regulator [Nitratireductor basaltis]|uniref:Putative transcriptional regulator n=1 Tax=Nitratireductor basaltis TaxID=472175 RepID=A0A084U541_9HYPH|nr:FadR/GntR family transcriptional regulator [Nitratireductor basaltis]KFB08077.1 putative transcriptional regulator [Nitratireductor basaltis]
METSKRKSGAGRLVPAALSGTPDGSGDRTLADSVYERVLAKIVNGETPVGGKLPTEHALCAEFGVSRPVLRQALRQLREDQVIVSRQGSGSYVTRKPDTAVLDFAPIGSIADIQRTFEFRAAIEGEAAYLAAERRTDEQLSRLQDALDELARCVDEGELGVDADEAFHALICTASDNHYFVAARSSMQANILMGLNLTRNLSLAKSRERLALVQAEHDMIFSAIRKKDAEAARNAMRRHIDNARYRVFQGD